MAGSYTIAGKAIPNHKVKKKEKKKKIATTKATLKYDTDNRD